MQYNPLEALLNTTKNNWLSSSTKLTCTTLMEDLSWIENFENMMGTIWGPRMYPLDPSGNLAY